MSSHSANPGSSQPDLTACDREPIHIPGSIEPHGVLLVLAAPGLTILQVSANSSAILSRAPNELLGTALSGLLSESSQSDLKASLQSHSLDGKHYYLSGLTLRDGAGPFDASIHRQPGLVLVELEPGSPDLPASAIELQSVLSTALSALESPLTLRALCQEVVRQVRLVTGFDRVMVYRFLEDHTGEVIAEDRRDDLSPYLGLRYPASDIPAQARRLYLLNTLRLKPDVNAPRALLVPLVNPLTGEPLDMSHCVLRAMSPVHDEYLRNMGVTASMSVSIVKDQRLWGLIACHHSTAKYVPQQVRLTCEVLARIFATHIASAEHEEQRDYAERLGQAQRELAQQLRGSGSIVDTLEDVHIGLRSGFRALGAALVLQGRVTLFGRTPSQQEVRGLVEWLGGCQTQPLYGTDRLAQAYPEASDWPDAAGLLSARLTPDDRDFLLWFRPEVVQVVEWGGRPDKPVEVTEAGKRISPRRSFERWLETMKGSSERWLQVECEFARRMRLLVAEALLSRQNREVARLNAELSRSNVELDAFAYAAAHDLQEPLRSILAYTQLLNQRAGSRLDPDSLEFLAFIEKGAERMRGLISTLLGYSQLGMTQELKRQHVPLEDVLRWVLVNLHSSVREAEAKVTHDPLPVVEADPHLMGQLLQNLIGNALKYRRPAHAPEIHLSVTNEPGFWHFKVQDNGQGFPPQRAEEIFAPFKRLHGREIPGAGIGLATCRRIVVRHGGKIWAESEPDQGSTFHFTLLDARQ